MNKEFIEFQWRTEDLGRAEFRVCVKMSEPGILEYWISPVQQHVEYYLKHFKFISEYPDFSVIGYEGLDNPLIWLFGWCKEHQTNFFSVYVPPMSKYLYCNHDGISFWKTKY